MRQDSSYKTPETLDNLRVSDPKDVAAGKTAVYHSMKKAIGQAGVLRGLGALGKLNQKDGFDCPSCAWPDPDGERSPFEYCENGAKAVASEATKAKAGRAFFSKSTVSELSRQSDFWLEQQGRLQEPMFLDTDSDRYIPVSWEKAFELIGKELNGLADPNEAVFYTSGRATNEAAFMYQLFARSFGTNNLPDCSNMCHESSGLALNKAIGVGKGTVSLEDLREAELILIIGQNPGTNHPRMLTTLQQAKEKGATIVSINPLQETGLKAFANPQRVSQMLGSKTDLADLFADVVINGDQALFQHLAKLIFKMEAEDAGIIDRSFIAEFTAGFGGYEQHIASLDESTLASLHGVDSSTVAKIARLIASNERIISCWAMGLTQHRNSVATIRELANLHFLRGAIGKRGAGLCPVRGHSNVQGDRTMGIWEKMPETFLSSVDREFGITSPRAEGFDTVGAIRAMHDGRVKVFFALGGNFLSATPDTEYTAQGLRNCSLTVQVSTKLNRSHLVTGKRALILPCLGRSERDMQSSGHQWLSVENSMGIVHSSSGQLEPASKDLKSEVAIVCGVAAKSLGGRTGIDWLGFADDYSKIRDAVERVIPGFENYNVRARQPGGYYLPNAAKDRRFNTDTGKANFSVEPTFAERPGEGRLLLMTVRSHDQFNTTVYGLDDRYRGIHGERRVVLMNVQDMKERKLSSGDKVDVVSVFEGVERLAPLYLVIQYEIPKSCVAMYFPEANVLVPIDHLAVGSETPASKSIPVEVRKRQA